MAEVGYCISARTMNPIPSPYPTETKSLGLLYRTSSKLRASIKRNDFSPITKKGNKAPRRLIAISTSEGRWHGEWNSDYIFSLRELQLEDLAEDGDREAPVSITLSIYKHAGFGFSVGGKITTSFTRKCSNCSSPYCREIDANFNVWVLPSSRDSGSSQLPERGGDDPSVIYVKPGCEADIDSLIQDTIRLSTSVKETCSELCEKSKPWLQHLGNQNASSIDKRWLKLLELRNALP